MQQLKRLSAFDIFWHIMKNMIDICVHFITERNRRLRYWNVGPVDKCAVELILLFTHTDVYISGYGQNVEEKKGWVLHIKELSDG